MRIMEEKIVPGSIVFTDSLQSYNVLAVSDFHHVWFNISYLFAEVRNYINSFENFWNQAKRHLRKFNGIPKGYFWLYLKECEWRFNTPDQKAQLLMLKQLVKDHRG